MQVRWGASLRCKVNDTVLVIFDDSWNRHTCPKCHNVGLLLSFIWHREFLPTNQLKWAYLDNQLSQTPTHLRGKFSCFENIFFWYFKVQFAHILVLENQLSFVNIQSHWRHSFGIWSLSSLFSFIHQGSHHLKCVATSVNFFFNLLFSNHRCVGSLKTNAPSIFGQF